MVVIIRQHLEYHGQIWPTQTKTYRDESRAGPPRLRKAEADHTQGQPEEISFAQPEEKDEKEMSLQLSSNTG